MFAFDRGYARVELIKELDRRQQPHLIRGKGEVIVEATVRGRRQRLCLGRLPHRTGVAIRYRHVLYPGQQQEPVAAVRCPPVIEPAFSAAQFAPPSAPFSTLR